MSVPLYGKQWYRRLVSDHRRHGALMDDHSLGDLATRFVVCFTPNYLSGVRVEKDNPVRLYATFRNYVEYFQFFLRVRSEDRCCYEIIYGEFAQKPHFDIDIADVSEPEKIGARVVDAVLVAICAVMRDKKINLDPEKDILVFSSHQVGKKASYHVVIDNYCHSTNQEAKAFYKEVVDRYAIITQGRYLGYIDPKVYSPRQQFRIVGNHKLGTGRTKTLDRTFTMEEKQYTYHGIDFTEATADLELVKRSLISFTADCQPLPSWIVEKPLVVYESTECSEGQLSQALEHLERHFGDAFRFTELHDAIITLKRESASYCPLCCRVHEHENPFIIVRDGKALWNCRRATRFFELGAVDDVEDLPAEVEEVYVPGQLQSLPKLDAIPPLKRLVSNIDYRLEK